MGKWTALAITADELANCQSTNRQNRQNPPAAFEAGKKEVLSVLSVRGLPISEVEAADRAELTVLVNRVADHNGFTDAERQAALTIALADHTAALDCFKTLAARIPLAPAECDFERSADCEYPKFTIGGYSFVMEVPKAGYDPFAILALFEQYPHGGTVH